MRSIKFLRNFPREWRLFFHLLDGFLHHRDARGQVFREMRASRSRIFRSADKPWLNAFPRSPQIFDSASSRPSGKRPARGALVERHFTESSTALPAWRVPPRNLWRARVDVLAHGNFPSAVERTRTFTRPRATRGSPRRGSAPRSAPARVAA